MFVVLDFKVVWPSIKNNFNSNMTDRQQEYIRLLQERNRLKKMMTEKSEEDAMKEELEKGFSTHFRGAHALKEKASSTRFEGKPSVKVHKSPSLGEDLLKRLVPSADHNDDSSGQISFRKDRNRSRSPDEEDDPVVASVPLAIPLVGSNTGANITNELFGQISTMSEEQKMALLQLLQQTTASSDSRSGKAEQLAKNSNLEETYESNMNAESEFSDPGNLRYCGKEDDNKSLINSVSAKFPTDAIPYSLPAIQERSVISSENIPINVKIRICSAWTNSKNIFLQGIRLRSIVSSPQESSQFLDLLQQFRVKILSGMIPLNANSEPCRLIPNLLGYGLSYKSSFWKSSFSSSSPVELIFESELPLSLFETHFSSSLSSTSSVSTIMSSLELLIWNGYESDTINASPVRDVDIYINDKCIWSGEMAPESEKLDIQKATDNYSVMNRNEGKPTFATRPFVSKPNALVRPSTVEIKKEELSVVSVPPKRLWDSPSRSKLTTPSEESKPDWLNFSKENNQKTLVLTPSTKERRFTDEALSPQKSKRKDIEASDHVLASSPSKSRLSTGKSRRRRNREAGSEENGVVLSPHHRKTPKGVSLSASSSRDGHDDENLRRSIEAVEHFEKSNLNRLEPTLAHHQPKRISKDPSVISIQDTMIVKNEVITTTSATPVKDLGNDKNLVEGLVSSEKGQFKTVITETRASKIEKVNFKLTNVLNDLAEVLAGLPKQPQSEEDDGIIDKPEGIIVKSSSVTSLTQDPSKSSLLHQQQQHLTPRIIEAESFTAADDESSHHLPSGKIFILEILSTHGDNSYVGLNGIEFFDENGVNIVNEKEGILTSIIANPMDVGVLPGYSDDPRKIGNLLDGINNTKDDLHQWLAPHQRVVKEFEGVLDDNNVTGNPVATVTVAFKLAQSISMIKIYNFNKSRTHNQRGVRDVQLFLDGKMIFKG
jgi:hypothetical protein